MYVMQNRMRFLGRVNGVAMKELGDGLASVEERLARERRLASVRMILEW